MRSVLVLGYFEVAHDGAGGHHAVLQVVYPKALEVAHLEVAREFFVSRLCGEGPVVEVEHKVLLAVKALEAPLQPVLHEHLLRCKASQQFVNVLGGAFCHKELARRYVEQRYAYGLCAKVYGSQKVVLAGVEHIVGHGHTGCYKLGNAAFYKFFGQFWVLKLVADGHAVACTYEPRQVGVECVVGKAGHLGACRLPLVVAACQGDAQHLRGGLGIVVVGFVKVAAAE